uniref:(northern house mosquito) hypothetical protein n=1 Tax=Culex pipiens TaxID=7175 RepID=A0A8D8C2V2_CULPI
MADLAYSTLKLMKGKVIVVVKIIESVFFNPEQLITVLGVIGGCIFENVFASVYIQHSWVLGNSFSGTVLFLLGLRMVCKAATVDGQEQLIDTSLLTSRENNLKMQT